MQSIVQKLPFTLHSKWRKRVARMKKGENKVAKFEDLVEFIESADECANDPIYGREALMNNEEKLKHVWGKGNKINSKTTSYATPT